MIHHEELKHVPEPTLRRLPTYHHYLKSLDDISSPTISCSVIGKELRLDPTQVRKDIAITGIEGKPKVGYNRNELMLAIERFLGWTDGRQAFLVGAGNLGRALLGYQRFNSYGLEIVAAFDSNPNLVGDPIEDKEVLPITKLADLARRMHIHIGIITTPADQAQFIADQMVAGGIRAIWNFAPVSLNTADGVIVQNEDLFASLAVLSRRLTTALGETE